MMQEEEHEEAASIVWAQLHHLCQELGRATAAQRADGQQPLDPLVLGEDMLLYIGGRPSDGSKARNRLDGQRR
jgi:hypothetical protein